MEPLVMVKNMEDVNAALEQDVRMLCIHTLDEKGIAALKASIPEQEGLLVGAKLRPELEFSTYAEIDMAWTLRDNGTSLLTSNDYFFSYHLT
jgi:hypothetical protein